MGYSVGGTVLIPAVLPGDPTRGRQLLAGVSACAVLVLALLLLMGRQQVAEARLVGKTWRVPATPPSQPAALKQPEYTRLNSLQAFACRARSKGFRHAELDEAAAYVAQYRRYVGQLRQTRVPDGAAPGLAAQARQSLLRALDDALQRAQIPPGPADAREPKSLVAAEKMLARSSADLKRSLATLTGVLRSYHELGEPQQVAVLERCVYDFATTALADTLKVAEMAGLYLLPQRSAVAAFGFGSASALKSFLTQQRNRAQVLAAYAEPFLRLLHESPGIVEDASAEVLASFWHNTLNELGRGLQATEPPGQVAALEAYFVHVVDNLQFRQCSRQLAAYTSPELGNDLFSLRRRQLERDVASRCQDHRSAQIQQRYGALAQRFNSELAGRYPFAGVQEQDVSAATLRTFLLDYAAQRQELEDYLDALPSGRAPEIRSFVHELDAVAALFRGNLSAGQAAQPFHLRLAFNLQRRDSRGADQIVAWAVHSDSQMAGWPNRGATLDWHVGEHLRLDLHWAAQSRWAPMTDPRQGTMLVDGPTARFAVVSPWALLRLIERHAVSDPASAASGQWLLGFSVPLQGQPGAGKTKRSQARLYLGVTLWELDAKAQTEVTLRLPAHFPRSAPVL
jgi:type VI secretion system protein ImpL